ncbi:hypothetical protein DM01DRAFT_1224885 [Hesseltinella vesiculosa]|uniref:Uncharacterized protein n=1 Tax=Hesseltinella vesiculosa TaxID=101127 RepID=A0A1X2GMI9_9FUNG|nr:hypothetical protein DM01DRAFT_1224885 [Hesseltinella vesiculosa]
MGSWSTAPTLGVLVEPIILRTCIRLMLGFDRSVRAKTRQPVFFRCLLVAPLFLCLEFSQQENITVDHHELLQGDFTHSRRGYSLCKCSTLSLLSSHSGAPWILRQQQQGRNNCSDVDMDERDEEVTQYQIMMGIYSLEGCPCMHRRFRATGCHCGWISHRSSFAKGHPKRKCKEKPCSQYR